MYPPKSPQNLINTGFARWCIWQTNIFLIKIDAFSHIFMGKSVIFVLQKAKLKNQLFWNIRHPIVQFPLFVFYNSY